jgi:hypothetical protein
LRKLVLAVIAAWVIGLPSVADAQQRGEGQGRSRPQVQQEGRPGGGFSGVLEGIARPRLNRAHDARRERGGGGGGDFRPRGGSGGGGGGDRNGRGR